MVNWFNLSKRPFVYATVKNRSPRGLPTKNGHKKIDVN
jgi:hypothetical protein